MGDPVLLKIAEPVANFGALELRELIQDMFDTMQAAQGAGLAAPQVGVSKRLVIFGMDANPRYPEAPEIPTTVLINPEIEILSQTQEDGWEGCLSVPGLRGLVPRYTQIRYSGKDPQGKQIIREAEGFHARVVQHECDHLDGTLYPMRMKDMRQFGYEDVLFPELDGELSSS